MKKRIVMLLFNYYGIKSFRMCKWKRNGRKRECKTGSC